MRAVRVYAHPESFLAYYRCIIDDIVHMRSLSV